MTSLLQRTVAAIEDGYDDAVKERFKMILSVPSDQKTIEQRFAEAFRQLVAGRKIALAEAKNEVPDS